MTATATPPGTGGRRLPNGELRRQVAAALAAAAPLVMSPREIADALGGRSSGAVANALAALAADGHAEQASGKPIRYRATGTTSAAATPTSSPAAAPAPGAPPAPRPAPKPRPARKPTGAAPKGTQGRPSGTAPVARPNGQMYHPRTLAGMPDVAALCKARDAEISVLLYGPPGSGKTSVAEAAFPDLITVAGDGDTVVSDLVGEYTQTPDGRFVFVHGPLPIAMREGRALFIDDATLIPPSVLATLYPAMDGRREIRIKANGGEVVTAEPGFYVLGGHNPGVHGAILSDALSSRFALQIQVSSDYDLATELKINRRAIRVARNLAKQAEHGEVSWVPQLRELLAFQKISNSLGEETALANLVGAAPEDDRATVANVVERQFGQAVAPLSLGERIKS